MSNCNTKNCCFHGIDLVVKCYDPQPEFKDFTVPTFWFNRCNGKLFLLKEIDADGKAVWIDITSGGSGGAGIEQILTECGLVQPDSEGQIKVKGSCGIRAVAEGCEEMCVDILTGFGLKGGGRVCNGESLTIEVDTDFAGDVTSPDPANVGDVPMYKDTTGKVITPSNINSVDGLTKITKSTAGEQLLRVETIDTEAGSNAGVEAKSTGSGYPYFQLTQGDQKWREIINPETGAREIRPVDDLSKDSLLNFLPNGVITGNLQPKCSARLTDSSPTFNRNEYFKIGSNIAFTKIRDEDGYNKSANNLFLGGNGSYLYYKIPYSGTWCIIYKFVIDQGRVASGTRIASRVNFGPVNDLQQIKTEEHYPNSSYKTISDTILLPLNKDDVVFVDVLIESDQGNPYIRVGAVLKEIDNYFGCFLTIG